MNRINFILSCMHGSRKFCQRGFYNVFFYIYFICIVLVDEGREGSNTTITAFRWRADDSSILNAGLVAFFIFRGSGPALLTGWERKVHMTLSVDLYSGQILV